MNNIDKLLSNRNTNISENKINPMGGVWTVDMHKSSLGTVLEHGLNDRVMIMGLPHTSGWRAITPVCLSHQTYVKKVHQWLRDNPNARKVSVLSVNTGEWVKVWESK